MRRRFAFAAASLLMCGGVGHIHSALAQQTDTFKLSQQIDAIIEARFKKATDAEKACMNKVVSDPAFSDILQKGVGISPLDLTLSQLSDPSFISGPELSALEEFQPKEHLCLKPLVEIEPQRIRDGLMVYELASEKNYLLLAEKKETWGVFEQNRQTMVSEMLSKYANSPP